MQQRFLPALTGAVLLLAGCAAPSSGVEPLYAPLAPYASLTCAKLNAEKRQLAAEIKTISARLDDTSAGDKLAIGVGVVFWPALFMIDGKGDDQDKLAILKGQQISVDDALIMQDCPPPAPKLRASDAKQPART
ncbi:MAG: hypothetical protein WBD13_05110 [Burkholderiaceae bacterium]